MPKCRFCGKENKKSKEMYLYKNGKSNFYYCNEEHYRLWLIDEQDKKRIFELVYFILDHETSNTSLLKEVNGLLALYKAKDVADYLDEKKLDIYRYMASKDFSSEYGAIRYLMAIIKNNMADYIKANKTEPTHEIPAENLVMDFGVYKHRRIQKKSLAEVMEELNE